MIYKLPSEVYQKIKAGEVIEDPASIIRELLDNAIDAKASEIIIKITEGGLETLSVQDNGTGMSKSDLDICFLEHTTSKISSFEDIFKLKTNGFRGEALSSICRVSQVSILSATDNNDIAEKILIENGQIIAELQTAYRKGTIIEVKNLFYNLPVRKKFLKSKTRETSKIKKEIYQKALGYPDIAFKLISNDKTILQCSATQNPEERMLSLLNIVPPVHPMFFKHPDITIKGLVTGIDQVFDTASELYIFINHRPIQSKSIYGVINRALSQLIPRQKYLGGCIYIFTDSKNIDPNVHPAKKEVKIYVEDTLLRGLYTSLRSIFYSGNYTTFIDLPQEPYNTQKPTTIEQIFHLPRENKDSLNSLYITPPSRETENLEKMTDENITVNEKEISEVLLDYKYIGTYSGTYWLVEKNKHMLLIDFHAAHERKRYEELKKKLLSKAIHIQPLLTPYVSKLGEQEWVFIENTLPTWESLGFDLELLGDFNILIRATPDFTGNNAIEDILNFIKEHYSEIFDRADLQDRILKFGACRKSYMANDNVPNAEIHYLLREIFNRNFPLTCPHGRPFVFALDQKTIESHFLR